MTDRKKIYWDACAWLGLLNGEKGRVYDLEVVWRKAEHGEIEIWTSAFCIAEVYRLRCEKGKTGLSKENDDKIDNLFDQDFVFLVQMDVDVARLAKSLLREHDILKKPSDAIHLATAVYWNVDQLHTYDSSDLLGLRVKKANGELLKLCTPDLIDGTNLFSKDPDE